MILAVTDVWMYMIWAAVALVTVALGSLYSGMETGVYVINKIRLDLHAEAGHHPARYLQGMLRKPRTLLAVLLIGTNLCRYFSTFAVTSMFLLAGSGERADLYTELLMTPLLFVLGDSVPKNTFQRLGERPMYAFSRVLQASDWAFRLTLLSPLVVGVSSLLMRLTRSGAHGDEALWAEGVAAAMAEGRASGVLTHFQTVMADRVMNLSDVHVADVMVPMERTVRVDERIGRDELIEVYRRHDYSRLPAMRDGKVVGVVDVFDALTGDRPPRDVTTPPHLIPAKVSVAEALYRMQQEHAVIAIVTDDDRHVGIVTVKDLVEEIVGEIEEW